MDIPNIPDPPPPSPTLDTDTGLSTNMQRFLNGIAAPESGGRYDVRYGGAKGPQTFTDYSAHPNTAEAIPGSDKFSTAAGKYQFIGSTWKGVADKLGLKDFSPENQDKGAAYLASSEYKRITGRDLESDLNDPAKYPAIATALQGQWPTMAGKNIATAMATPGTPTVRTAAATPPVTPVAPTAAGQADRYAQALARDNQYAQLQRLAMVSKLLQPAAHQAANPFATSITPWAQPLQPSNPLATVAQYAQLGAVRDRNPLTGV